LYVFRQKWEHARTEQAGGRTDGRRADEGSVELLMDALRWLNDGFPTRMMGRKESRPASMRAMSSSQKWPTGRAWERDLSTHPAKPTAQREKTATSACNPIKVKEKEHDGRP